MKVRFDFLSRLTALLLFAAAVVLYSWNSDDAYHSYVMAKHLVEGKGLVYNTGFRATASTCPLLTLVEAVVFLFTDSADVCALLIGLIFSTAAAWTLFFRICRTPFVALCLSGVMVASRCFLSFTTSGLENPMLFFFGAVFFSLYFSCRVFSRRRLFAISLLMSLVAMTRTDAVLVFVPMAVWSYMAKTRESWAMRMAMAAAGLAPFAAWTCFSVVYYGFPFPNTYYAKLYTGIPAIGYLVRGLAYYPASWLIDPMLFFVPVFAVGLAVEMRDRRLVPLLLGLAAYSLYVVLIGGDFMAGRHLTLQFFLLICVVAFLVGGERWNFILPRVIGCRDRCLIALVTVICFAGCIWNYCSGSAEGAWWGSHDVLDERVFYLSEGGEIPLFKSVWKSATGGGGGVEFRDDYRRDRILDVYGRGDRGLCFGGREESYKGSKFLLAVLFGKDIFAASGLDMYLTDVIALQDPLLARLKAYPPDNWRVGHIARDVPRGYHETLASGVNCIEDASLHEYYDKLLVVMKGPLFDRERLRTILYLNCGKYDRLLEQYERNRLAQGN